MDRIDSHKLIMRTYHMVATVRPVGQLRARDAEGRVYTVQVVEESYQGSSVTTYHLTTGDRGEKSDRVDRIPRLEKIARVEKITEDKYYVVESGITLIRLPE